MVRTRSSHNYFEARSVKHQRQFEKAKSILKSKKNVKKISNNLKKVDQSAFDAKPKQSKVRITVKKGGLAPWKAVLPIEDRRWALLEALHRTMDEENLSQHDAAIKIVKRLNVLYVYRKNNASPKVVSVCNKILDDEEWFRSELELPPLDRKKRKCPKA